MRRCSRWPRGPRRRPRALRRARSTRGEVVVAHVIRGAIHAVAPGDHALYGRALIARDEDELAEQLGEQVRRLAAEERLRAGEALEEVAAATKDALAGAAGSTGIELHQAMRERRRRGAAAVVQGLREPPRRADDVAVRDVKAGARLDAERRYVPGDAGPRAGGGRGGAAVPALLRPGRRPARSPTGPGSPSRTPGACGTRSTAT